ncbi:MAG: hypothetical protein AAGA55_09290 [Planctomycetota bacterium]
MPQSREAVGADESPARPQTNRQSSEFGFDIDGYRAQARRQTARFAEMAKARGEPRMVVFLGREFSAEVREWLIAEKAMTPEGEVYRAVNNAVNVNPGTPREARLQIEKSFADRFRAAGVPMIDLRVIMRRQAAATGLSGQSDGALSTREVESVAAAEDADVMIELLIDRTAGGYAILARATETATGEQLGQTDWITASRTERYCKVTVTRPVAGPDGWKQERDESTSLIYRAGLGDLADMLAVDLMGEIEQTWR